MQDIVESVLLSVIIVVLCVLIWAVVRGGVSNNILSEKKTFMFIADADEIRATVVVNN